MNQPCKYALTTLPAICIATVICYFFIDKPLAHHMMALHLIHRKGAFSTHISVLLTQLSYLIITLLFVVLFFMKASQKSSRFVDCLSLMCTSMAISFFIKSVLQFTFGRYVPRYRSSDFLLFERNPHLYGFHWFQSGCFPSGHMSVFCAAMFTITCYYKRLTTVAIVLSVALGGMMIILNYHFLSDIIAGAYLGITISLALYYLERCNRTTSRQID